MKNSTKNFLLLFLALVALGGGALAWQQYLELVTLRAAAVSPTDRSAVETRLADAQRYTRELEDQLGALREANQAPVDSAAVATTRNPNPNGFGRGRGGQDNMRAILETPEVRQLMAQQQKSALDLRYAALFKTLNLAPAQLETFKSLLLEKQSAMQDVMAAARGQGLDPRSDPEGFRKLVATTQGDLDANLKAVLGDESFTQYQQFQQSQPQRNVVSQLQQSLSYTDTPLTDAQSAQLLQILATTSTATAGGGGPPDGGGRGGPMGGGGGGGGNGPTALITTQTVAQAQTVLNATQVQALQQLQQTQQAQQQLEQIMRGNNGGGAVTRTNPGGGG